MVGISRPPVIALVFLLALLSFAICQRAGGLELEEEPTTLERLDAIRRLQRITSSGPESKKSTDQQSQQSQQIQENQCPDIDAIRVKEAVPNAATCKPDNEPCPKRHGPIIGPWGDATLEHLYPPSRQPKIIAIPAPPRPFLSNRSPIRYLPQFPSPADLIAKVGYRDPLAGQSDRKPGWPLPGKPPEEVAKKLDDMRRNSEGQQEDGKPKPPMNDATSRMPAGQSSISIEHPLPDLFSCDHTLNPKTKGFDPSFYKCMLCENIVGNFFLTEDANIHPCQDSAMSNALAHDTCQMIYWEIKQRINDISPRLLWCHGASVPGVDDGKEVFPIAGVLPMRMEVDCWPYTMCGEMGCCRGPDSVARASPLPPSAESGGPTDGGNPQGSPANGSQKSGSGNGPANGGSKDAQGGPDKGSNPQNGANAPNGNGNGNNNNNNNNQGQGNAAPGKGGSDDKTNPGKGNNQANGGTDAHQSSPARGSPSRTGAEPNKHGTNQGTPGAKEGSKNSNSRKSNWKLPEIPSFDELHGGRGRDSRYRKAGNDPAMPVQEPDECKTLRGRIENFNYYRNEKALADRKYKFKELGCGVLPLDASQYSTLYTNEFLLEQESISATPTRVPTVWELGHPTHSEVSSEEGDGGYGNDMVNLAAVGTDVVEGECFNPHFNYLSGGPPGCVQDGSGLKECPPSGGVGKRKLVLSGGWLSPPTKYLVNVCASEPAVDKPGDLLLTCELKAVEDEITVPVKVSCDGGKNWYTGIPSEIFLSYSNTKPKPPPRPKECDAIEKELSDIMFALDIVKPTISRIEEEMREKHCEFRFNFNKVDLKGYNAEAAKAEAKEKLNRQFANFSKRLAPAPIDKKASPASNDEKKRMAPDKPKSAGDEDAEEDESDDWLLDMGGMFEDDTPITDPKVYTEDEEFCPTRKVRTKAGERVGTCYNECSRCTSSKMDAACTLIGVKYFEEMWKSGKVTLLSHQHCSECETCIKETGYGLKKLQKLCCSMSDSEIIQPPPIIGLGCTCCCERPVDQQHPDRCADLQAAATEHTGDICLGALESSLTALYGGTPKFSVENSAAMCGMAAIDACATTAPLPKSEKQAFIFECLLSRGRKLRQKFPNGNGFETVSEWQGCLDWKKGTWN